MSIRVLCSLQLALRDILLPPSREVNVAPIAPASDPHADAVGARRVRATSRLSIVWLPMGTSRWLLGLRPIRLSIMRPSAAVQAHVALDGAPSGASPPVPLRFQRRHRARRGPGRVGARARFEAVSGAPGWPWRRPARRRRPTRAASPPTAAATSPPARRPARWRRFPAPFSAFSAPLEAVGEHGVGDGRDVALRFCRGRSPWRGRTE